MRRLLIALVTAALFSGNLMSQEISHSSVLTREHLLMDNNWRFAYGHPSDAKKDYMHATGYFSYVTKTGNGDGPAAKNFNDGAWRVLNLPHDWAVEQGFAANASHSHGYRTVGREFPETSVGWYRKSFDIPESDLGKRISIQFDGVHRAARVWVNGFYLGTESSGYSDFQYDISAYLNYGGENVISVRVDVTLEEGWFYEGAGIYRHVWLNKTAPLHVAYNGTFVYSEVKEKSAILTANTVIENKNYDKVTFDILETVVNAKNEKVASSETKAIELQANSKKEISSIINVDSPILWSIENPYLYKLKTSITQNDKIVDEYETSFGIRSLRYDANEGFFLNGKHVKIKGTCNHQDHAGVGTALPDALQDFRIKRLKEMGGNAYRCAHNPPTPELLDACDRLGMLVMVESRLLATTPEMLDRLQRMMERDRNHPSVIIWCLGNEEWKVEGNATGTRISNEVQAFARKFDPSRPFTIAASAGWGLGVDIGLDVAGFNYIKHGDIDEHHKNFPNQPSIGSEESTSNATRGIYFDNYDAGQRAPTNRNEDGSSAEFGWKFYDERPFLSGLFLWTGFDYRGEPNPLGFPAVSSQYGIMDVCGFPKETYYYLQSWWGTEPTLKLTPHWNWEGKEGDTIQVRANSNCDEVELFFNGKSQGRKTMTKNSHLKWFVAYQPGVLLAKGYKNGKQIIEDKVETASTAKNIILQADRASIKANGEDVSVITIELKDAKDRFMPTANNEITFSLSGPGKIIGVGNGNPASHEPDKYFEKVEQLLIPNGKISLVDKSDNQLELNEDFDDSKWPVYVNSRDQIIFPPEKTVVIRCEFTLPEFNEDTKVTLFSKSLAINQSLYVNGHLVAKNIEREAPNQVYELDHRILKPGKNTYAIIGSPLFKRTKWEDLNTDPGLIQIVNPEPVWKRKVFNGLAQIIVQATSEAGEITLKAESPELSGSEIKIATVKSVIRPKLP